VASPDRVSRIQARGSPRNIAPLQCHLVYRSVFLAGDKELCSQLNWPSFEGLSCGCKAIVTILSIRSAGTSRCWIVPRDKGCAAESSACRRSSNEVGDNQLTNGRPCRDTLDGAGCYRDCCAAIRIIHQAGMHSMSTLLMIGIESANVWPQPPCLLYASDRSSRFDRGLTNEAIS